MKREHLITILGRKTDAEDSRKGVARPSVRKPFYSRRIQSPGIIYYDLAQINTGTAESPVWSDHPILKSPAYTTAATAHYLPYFSGVDYFVEPFDDADFAAYTQMFFDAAPVAEWNQTYRRISGDAEINYLPRGDWRVSMRTESPLEEPFLGRNAFSSADDPSSRAAALEYYGWYWDYDKSKVIYRSLPRVTGNYFPHNGFDTLTNAGYYGFSTDSAVIDEIYKITAVRDWEAADVGVLAPRGTVEVYLMPHVSFFASLAFSADFETAEVWGLCFQITPREKWARYIDPFNNSAGGFGLDALLADYLAYQKARTGIQASRVVYTGSGGDPFAYTETTITIEELNVSYGYGFQTIGGTSGSEYFTSGMRGGPASDFAPRFGAAFRGTASGVYGASLFQATEPFLVAVIKTGGAFYYVWDVSGVEFGEGSFSNSVSVAQGGRFRLSRGVDWDASYESLPLQPKDGTGDFWDL